MKKLLTIFLLLYSISAFADNTAAVQAAVSTGTLIKGTYSVGSTITVNHSFNGNGSTINYTGTGKCFSLTAANIKVQKFNLVGASDATNPSGTTGINILADNDTVSFCHISAFTAYGLLGGNNNTPVVADCNIFDTGYIGLFWINSVPIAGGEIARDTIDRSMISASQGAGVTQGCLQLKGSSSSAYATGWYVHDSRLIQSSSPADLTAECCESNKTPWARFVNVTCIGGSIGLSMVGAATHVVVSNCTASGQNAEGFELADPNSKFINCTVSGQLNDGFLFDGTTVTDTLSNVTIGGCARYCVYVIQSSNSLFFTGCNFTSSAAHPNIELSTGYGITLFSTNIIGASTGNYAIELSNSIGSINATGGTISNFTGKLFHLTTGTSFTANNLTFRGVSYTGVVLGQDIFGSYTLGSNVNFSLSAFTTGRLIFPGGKLYLKH